MNAIRVYNMADISVLIYLIHFFGRTGEYARINLLQANLDFVFFENG